MRNPSCCYLLAFDTYVAAFGLAVYTRVFGLIGVDAAHAETPRWHLADWAVYLRAQVVDEHGQLLALTNPLFQQRSP